MRIHIIAAMLALLPVVASAEIYRWVDEDGRVHFSDNKQDLPGQAQVELKQEKVYWKKLSIEVEGRDVLLSASDRDRIEQDVNNVYRFYDQKLYFDMYKTVPVKVVVFKDFEAYDRFVRANSSGQHGRTGGMYFRKDKLIALYMHKDKERFYRTLKHETSHAVAHTLTDYLPSWLNEGLAENMETLSSQNGELLLNHHNHNSKRVRKLFNEGKLMRLRDFLSLNSRDWRAQDLASDYALHCQAGEITRMLLSSGGQRSFITKMIHRYKRGSRTLAFAVVEKEYIGGLSLMEANWMKWLTGSETITIRL